MSMNVIIRLQNLPWAANALDIRNYFKGLSIPEGGVHIVGGENGDAFIAFRLDSILYYIYCFSSMIGSRLSNVKMKFKRTYYQKSDSIETLRRSIVPTVGHLHEIFLRIFIYSWALTISTILDRNPCVALKRFPC